MKKLIYLIIAGTVLASCKKKDDATDNTQQKQTTPSPTVVINGAQGTLVALNTTTTISIAGFEQTIVSGTATATFTDNGKNVSAGKVSCMGEDLDYQNGAYFSMPSATNPTGVDFNGSTVDWEAAGNGNIPAFTYSYMEEVPQINGIDNVDSDVDRASNLLVRLQTGGITDISSADSLMYNVIDKNGKMLSVTTAPNIKSHEFTSSELGTLDAGFAYVQITAYNYLVRDENGYKLAFINMGAITKNVTLK